VPGGIGWTEWVLSALNGYELDLSTRFDIHLALFGLIHGMASNLETETAATAATGWPWNSAFSRAMTLRHIQRMSWMPSITDLSSGKSTTSFAVTTAFTPGSASAFEVSMERIRACACGLRSILPQIMPGMVLSAE